MLGEAFENRDDPWARTLMGELTLVAGMGDFYLAHEHLEDTNEPCYFHEFMAQSRRHGLDSISAMRNCRRWPRGTFPCL